MTSANEQDPVLYRLYEVLVVYGWSYKALIQEKFGDGIMSAIDFRTSLVRKPDPKGDRVVITLDGKVCFIFPHFSGCIDFSSYPTRPQRSGIRSRTHRQADGCNEVHKRVVKKCITLSRFVLILSY